MTPQELATQYLEYFVEDTRDNGDNFIKTTDSRPEELFELIKDAHGEMLPDDYRYQFIHEALIAIAEHDDVEDAENDMEADIYYHDVFKWLASRNDRIGYVDQYIEDFGASKLDAFTLLQCGQQIEKQEVFHSVLNSLQEICDDIEDEYEEDEE